MKKGWVKKIIIGLIIIATIASIGYGGYALYNYAVENAIKRIKQSVSISVKKSVISAINPFSWAGKLFGHRKSKKIDEKKENVDKVLDAAQ